MSEAFGAPGMLPTWASARKQAVGTALSPRSHVWFTIAEGVLTEVYYPSVDCPNQRDLQFLVTDGGELFHEERRDLLHEIEWLEEGIPAFRITSRDPKGRYRLIKTVCTDPKADCVMMRVQYEPLVDAARHYRLYVLWAPHMGNLGADNHAITYRDNRECDWLVAWRGSACAALTATAPFPRMSAGYVGYSDGWQDRQRHAPGLGPRRVRAPAALPSAWSWSKPGRV